MLLSLKMSCYSISWLVKGVVNFVSPGFRKNHSYYMEWITCYLLLNTYLMLNRNNTVYVEHVLCMFLDSFT
jgi:hypothetical protein